MKFTKRNMLCVFKRKKYGTSLDRLEVLLSYTNKRREDGTGGHRHRPLCRRYPTPDIDISYSDIGTKNVGLNPFIPISEEFRYRHQLPFRYRTKSISDIPISKIDKSFLNDPRKMLLHINLLTSFKLMAFLSCS